MWIFGQSAEKRREKTIRKEAKIWIKKLMEAGMDRQSAKNYLDMLQELIIEGCYQSEAYAKSKKQIILSMIRIENLLEEIREQEAGEVQEDLKKLTNELSGVFHDCTIREDDTDFVSTCIYLKQKAESYDGSERLMLQSELENLLHLLGEAEGWEEPDFCALAFFYKYGNKSELGQLSNTQRNEMLVNYYSESYWNEFERVLKEIGMQEMVQKWIAEKIDSRIEKMERIEIK